MDTAIIYIIIFIGYLFIREMIYNSVWDVLDIHIYDKISDIFY